MDPARTRGLRDETESAPRCAVAARWPSTRRAREFEKYVVIDLAFVRPAEVDHLIGNPGKERQSDLGLEAAYVFEELSA